MLVRIRQRLTCEEGISLVEMLAAIFILGLVLAALLSATVGSLYAIQGNERQVRASALANQLLEDLQAVSWEGAGFYTSDPGFVSGFEGEDTVVLPGSAPALVGTPPLDCDANRPIPQCRVVRDGITYDVTRHVTWVDASSTSDPKDYKRLMTILTWSQRGKARTLRTEAFRSPSPQDKPLRPDVTPTRVYLTDPDPTDPMQGGLNVQALTVKAATPVPAQSVQFRYPRRDGSLSTWTSLSPAPDKRQWTYTILPNTEGFANGEAMFEFRVTFPDGSTSDGTSRVLFLHDLELALTDVIVNPDPIKAGSGCNVTLTVDVQGATTSDSVTAAWNNGPSGASLAVSNNPPSGARFQITYPDAASFNPGRDTVNLDVNRVVDNTSLTASKSFDVVACP